jgi:hypothetical protein
LKTSQNSGPTFVIFPRKNRPQRPNTTCSEGGSRERERGARRSFFDRALSVPLALWLWRFLALPLLLLPPPSRNLSSPKQVLVFFFFSPPFLSAAGYVHLCGPFSVPGSVKLTEQELVFRREVGGRERIRGFAEGEKLERAEK